MKPAGHYFNTYTSDGQRDVVVPADLADRHRNHVDDRILKRIQGDAAQHLVSGDLAIIKTVDGEFAYLSILETIQDAFRRRVQAVHSMPVLIADLLSENLVLLAPPDKESARALVTPGQVHARRLLTDIQAAIAQAASSVDLPTNVATTDWTARELNYLIDNQFTSIVAKTEKSPEASVADFLARLPPSVSAALSFATRCVPQGSFNLALYPTGMRVPAGRGVTHFPSIEEFVAAVAATNSERVLDDGGNTLDLLNVAQRCNGSSQLDVLRAFRAGLRRGDSHANVVSTLVAGALEAREPGVAQRAIEGLQQYLPLLENLPEDAKATLRASLPTILRPDDPGYSILQALDPGLQEEEADAAVSPAEVAEVAEQPADSKSEGPSELGQGWEAIDDPAEVLKQLSNLIAHDPSTGVHTVVSAVRRFADLVIKGGYESPDSEESAKLVHGVWEEINRWGKQGRRDERRLNLIVEALRSREHPTTPSLFDNLIYVTRRAGARGRNSRTFAMYDKLLENTISNYPAPRRILFSR